MHEVFAFFAEIRATPGFAAAASASPIWDEHLDNAARALQIIWHDGDENSSAIDFFDRVRSAVSSETLTIKQRLNRLEDLLREWQRCRPDRSRLN